MSEIFDDDLLNPNDLCDDDLLNDLCAVFIGGALRDRDLDRDTSSVLLRDLFDVILSLFLLQTIY